MNWLDFAILAVIGFAVLAGWRLGGIQIGVTGVGIFVGIAMASRLHDDIEPLFSNFTDSANGAEIGGYLAIFIIVMVASGVAGFIVRGMLKKVMLGWLDNVLGLGVGLVLVLAIGSGVFSAVQSYPILGLEKTIDDSSLGSFLADNFDTVLRGLKFIPSDLGKDIPIPSLDDVTFHSRMFLGST